jgi:competence ComEA-like helix-hairpin-helix protein
MLKHWFYKTGLTSTEIKIFTFLILMLLIGLVYKYYFNQDEVQQAKIFDYSRSDSLFISAGEKFNTSPNVQNGEKIFDYKQEVLDFNKQNFSIVKTEKTTLEKSINLNTAGLEDLITLPGVGEKTAVKILDLRTERGSFKKLEELQEIKGIGLKTFNKLKNYVYIE